MRYLFPISVVMLAALSACKTVPEPEAEDIVILPPPVQTCAPVSTLQKVVIPAETRTQTAITEIDNAPYEPIQTRTTRTIVVTPAKIIYVNSEGKEVLDICEKDTIEIGETGPAAGEIIASQDEGG